MDSVWEKTLRQAQKREQKLDAETRRIEAEERSRREIERLMGGRGYRNPLAAWQ